MRMRHEVWSAIFAIVALLSSGVVRAEGETVNSGLVKSAGLNAYHNSQFHFRGGPITGTISSPGTGGNPLSTTGLNMEYEFMTRSRHSYYIQTSLAYDMGTARMPYYGIGAGFRYYLGSTGVASETSGGGYSLTSIPRWRYYIGAGAGISQVIVQVFSDALTVNSTLFEVGAHAGTIYQLTRSTGLELQAGYGMGFGFSSVAAGATLIHFMAGVSVYF